jgi:polysaccharide biosynthesis/export protein
LERIEFSDKLLLEGGDRQSATMLRHMEVSRHCHLIPGAIAVILLGCTLVFPSTGADENGAKSAPRQVAMNVSSSNPESSNRAFAPSSVVIEQVLATGVGHSVQVRVVGSDTLSCAPFRLNDPARLVLDCTGTRVQARLTPIRVRLDPVRFVRVGQFKTDVARVVIELERQSPYTVHADGNTFSVVFESSVQQVSHLESTGKQLDPATRPVEQSDEHVASTTDLVSPDNLLLPRHAEVTSAGLIGNEGFPIDRGASTPLLPPSALVVPRDIPSARDSSSEAGTPAGKPESAPAGRDYVIGPQDLLVINVWRDPELSRSVPVRPDGKISLPLVGEIVAGGLTPDELRIQITKGLDLYIRNPQVTVIVQEANSHKFYVIGEVEHPGVFALTTNMTVLDALAAAGGFRDFAKVRQIYLLRLMPDGSRKRFHFDYTAAVNGKNSYRDIEVQTGDTLIVP